MENYNSPEGYSADQILGIVNDLFKVNVANREQKGTLTSMARHIYFNYLIKELKMRHKEAGETLEGFGKVNAAFSSRQYLKLLEGNGWNEKFDKMVQRFRSRMNHLGNLAQAKPTYEELEKEITGIRNKSQEGSQRLLTLEEVEKARWNFLRESKPYADALAYRMQYKTPTITIEGTVVRWKFPEDEQDRRLKETIAGIATKYNLSNNIIL